MILLVILNHNFLYALYAVSRKSSVCLAILFAVMIAEITAALAAPASNTGWILSSPMPPIATTGTADARQTLASFVNPAAEPAFVFVAVANTGPKPI